MSSNLKFSVVIPCRNAGPWIEPTLRSVAEQTYAIHETIIIDDGSTDDTIDRIKSTGVQAKIMHSTCRNGAGTRNIGIAAATGDWIAFLDADDVWYPDHLERAANLLENSQDIGFLNWFDTFSNDAPEKFIPRQNQMDINQPTSGISDQQFFENYARTHWFNMHGCVVKRTRLLEVGMLDETQTRRHDIEMWLRVVKGCTWSYDPVPSSAYRMDTPGSISRNVADASYFAFRAIEKNINLFPKGMGKQLLSGRARSSIIDALAAGTSTEISRAYSEGFAYLNPSQQLLFRLARTLPKMFRTVTALKRFLAKRISKL